MADTTFETRVEQHRGELLAWNARERYDERKASIRTWLYRIATNVSLWFLGRDDYGAFIRRVFALRGTGWCMIPTAANGQPAVAAYAPDADGVHRLHTLQVFTVAGGLIAHTVVFQSPAVFAAFDLPGSL